MRFPAFLRFVTLTSAVCLVTGLVGASAASAEDFSLIDQKGQLSLGTFTNKATTRIRVDGEDGDPGTAVDWGSIFGESAVTRLRLDGVWQFSDKHHLRIMFTDYSRSVTATLDEDIEWDGDLLLAGSSATGRIGFSILEAAYEYAPWHSDTMELSLTAGLHYTAFDARLTADVGTLEGGVSEILGGKASVDAPLPVFGARGMWRLGRSIYLDAQVQWFALSIDEYSGSILNYRAGLIWQPRKLLGLGIGYDSFNVDVKVKNSDFRGKLDWTYQGPQVFFNVAF